MSETDERKNMLNIYVVFKLYNRFTRKVKYNNMLFYDWLKHYIKYDVDYDTLHKICDMFVLKDVSLPCELIEKSNQTLLNNEAMCIMVYT